MTSKSACARWWHRLTFGCRRCNKPVYIGTIPDTTKPRRKP